MYLLRLRQADIARRYKQRAPRQPTATRWKAWPGPKLLCIPTPQYFFFLPASMLARVSFKRKPFMKLLSTRELQKQKQQKPQQWPHLTG